MEASESYADAGTVSVTFKGHKSGAPADALHVAAEDGSETVLPLGVTVLVSPEIADLVTNEHNAAVYMVERD